VQKHRESMRALQNRHAFAVILPLATTLQISRESMAPKNRFIPEIER
jgi:hypothetical protein